jgi:glucokinase
MTIVGVDLGGTKILSRLIDPETGHASGRSKLPTPKTGRRDILAAVAASIAALPGADDAEAIGLGMPGLVSSAGVVGPCANLVGWTEPFPLSEHLSQELGKPVNVANDVNCGAIAEHRVGAGRGVDDFLAVFVGTGVGGGLILEGDVVIGSRGMAGEIGHLTVHPGGRPCNCGGRGHLEAYAGRAGIEAEARRRAERGDRNLLVDYASEGALKSRHLLRAMDEGDQVALDLLDDASDALAVAIGSVATLLDLPRIVLGGGVADKLGQSFIDRVASSELFGGFGTETCELVLAERIDDAGAVGAALLAADSLT